MPVGIRFAGKLDGKGGVVSKGSSSGKHRSEPYSTPPGAAWNQETPLMNPGACGSSQIVERKEAAPSDNLYITGLPVGLDNDTLKAMFSQYGVVVQCKVLEPRPDATAIHALVRFSTVEEAVVVKQALSGYIMQGLSEPLTVNYAIQKDKGAEKGDKGWKGGKGCEKGCEGLFWDELAPLSWEGKGWKGDGWKGDGWKGDSWKGDGWKGEPCWKGGTALPAAWKGEKGSPAWKGADVPAAYRGKGAAGGKGPDDRGKGLFISMEKVLEGFARHHHEDTDLLCNNSCTSAQQWVHKSLFADPSA